MTDPRFSIITINFNDKLGLQKTIESVISQTFADIEFIVIDGDSSDGSKLVIDQYSNQITKWVSEKDNGIYHAMNKGIKIATGDYLLFLNSGDIFIDQKVLTAAANNIDGNADLYYGDIYFNQKDKITKVNFPSKLTFDFFFDNNLSHQATFIKRVLFDTIFMYNEAFKVASDWEFNIYAVCKANVSYSHLNQYITIYDGAGISSDENNRKTISEERNITINKYFPAFKADYERLSLFKQRRVKQFFLIKEHKSAWEVLKVLMKFILLFIPKTNERNDKNNH
jgi:glycosyltransferase involved in cell wall biosynthesis